MIEFDSFDHNVVEMSSEVESKDAPTLSAAKAVELAQSTKTVWNAKVNHENNLSPFLI